MVNRIIKGSNAIKSYAKINIHLEVLNRRSDNYHNLFSLMAELNFYDFLKLENYDFSKKPGSVSVEILNSGGEFPSIVEDVPLENNLITIAVKNYMNVIGSGGHFIFSLTKNIPCGAGLGGGSSNAAAALKIVSAALERDDDENLLNAASATGSDVPFFLKGGFGFVEGKGEMVSTLEFSDESYILLVNNGIHIDTGSAYKALNKSVSDETVNCNGRIKAINEKISIISEWKDLFRNDFEDVVFRLYPEIGSIKAEMYQNGAFFASMTGTGSTVFGLYSSKDSAESMKKMLEKKNNRVYLTNFRGRKN